MVFYFMLGLIFPLLGGFNLGLLLAALGYGLSYGGVVSFAKKNDTLKDYSSSIEDVSVAGVKAGEPMALRPARSAPETCAST